MDSAERLSPPIAVPYGMTVHGEEEIEAVVKTLRSSTQMGSNVREMERRVAEKFDKKHGVMVNSGSSALLLAMEVFDFPKGSEIITPVLTFSTTVACIVKNGHIPAFVDADPQTYCIDVDQIEAMITDKTKAVVIPNLIGNIPDWDRIKEICDKHNLLILEDSADTLGGTLRGRSSGHHSDISITSFYGSHVINCAGNGGMICVNDDEMARKLKILRSWGRSSSVFDEKASEAIENRFNVTLEGMEYDAKFVFEAIGYNLEPSEVGASFGLVQMDKLTHNIESRRANFAAHEHFFKQYEDYFILPKQSGDVYTGWLAYPVIVRDDAPFKRKEFMIFLERLNIQTRVLMTGNILRQPGFKDIDCRKSESGYSGADQVMRGGVMLACHHGLTDDMMAHVHTSVAEFMKAV